MHAHGKPPHKILITAIILTLCFAVVEAVGGYWSGSLTLLGDAGHMFSDALALSIAAFAAWIALKPPSNKHTFGLSRAEVIAAWISSALMCFISIAIIIEAIRRFQVPEHVHGASVMLIALMGLIMNVYIAWLLSRGEQTLNVRAALLHVLSDVLGSVAALISGAVIYYTGWVTIDPILSIIISLLILLSSYRVLRESLNVLMQGTPRHIDAHRVASDMRACKDVTSIHDLHIWTLSSGTTMLSSHIVVNDMTSWNQALAQLRQTLKHNYGIYHITLQPELNLGGTSADIGSTSCDCPHTPHKDKEHHHGCNGHY